MAARSRSSASITSMSRIAYRIELRAGLGMVTAFVGR
jgi:hypothetical protein